MTWIFREKLLPVPKPDPSPPPHFRSTDGPPRLHVARAPTVAQNDRSSDAEAKDGPAGEDVVGDDPASPPHGDDLKIVKGIGPVYEHRLAEIGIRSFADLASGNADSIAEAIEVAESLVAEWIEQARSLSAEP